MTTRSEAKKDLAKPSLAKLVSHQDRSFSIAAPTLWRSIPDTMRTIPNVKEFKKQLKTHLFQIAFAGY